jgi:uncharacterized protein YbjT (DUF2867 family)
MPGNTDGNTAIVIGATGQVGSHLVQDLLRDPYFDKVRVLVRRYYNLVHPKLENRLVNFKELSLLGNALGTGHTIFCCIGTTMKKVKKDKHLYREIDFDIPLNSARAGLENGILQFVHVSALAELPFASLHILRPSVLLGPRAESRPAESFVKTLMQPLSFVFTGKFLKYRPIPAADVARAMISASKLGIMGLHIYEYAAMQQLISQSGED